MSEEITKQQRTLSEEDVRIFRGLAILFAQAANTRMPFQILTQGKWCVTEGAPNAGSTLERWRVKPVTSIDHWWITPGLPPTQDPKHAEQWKQENREVVFVKTSKEGGAE